MADPDDASKPLQPLPINLEALVAKQFIADVEAQFARLCGVPPHLMDPDPLGSAVPIVYGTISDAFSPEELADLYVVPVEAQPPMIVAAATENLYVVRFYQLDDGSRWRPLTTAEFVTARSWPHGLDVRQFGSDWCVRIED